MRDPILEEIWRVREELLKKYGGFEGVFKQVQKVDRSHRARLRRNSKKKGQKRSPASR